MKKYYVLAGILFLLCASSVAQSTFYKQYSDSGHSMGYQAIATSDGGFAGCANSADNQLFVVKTDSLGNILWSQTIPVTGGIRRICEATDGSIFCASGGFNIVKLSPSGNIIWIRTYYPGPDAYATGLIPTSDGGFVCYGYSQLSDLVITKVAADGAVIMSRKLTMPASTFSFSLSALQDGGYALTASTYYSDHRSLLLVRADSLMNMQWSMIYPGDDEDRPNGITELNNGDLIVCGSYGYGFSDRTMYVLRTNASGVPQWRKTLSGSGDNVASAAASSNDGGCVVAGWINANGCLIKFDSLWQTVYIRHPVSATGRICSIEELNEGQFLLSDYTFAPYSSVNQSTFGILRTTAEGTVGSCSVDEADTLLHNDSVTALIVSPAFINLTINYSTASISSSNLYQVVTICGDLAAGSEESEIVETAIFPNPASSEIQVTGIPIGATLSFSNAAAELVLRQKATGSEVSLDISRLPKGIYFLEISDPQSLRHHKIVVN